MLYGIRAFFQAIIATSAFVAYLIQRDWFINATNLWFVGFYDGATAMITVFVFADRYGEAIHESYLGLRELGHRRKTQEVEKRNQ